MANTIQLLKNIQATIKRNLWWVLLFSILIASIKAYIVKQQHEQYISYSKIFPLSADGGDNGMGALRAQLGMGGDSKDPSRYYNVNELINSRTLSRKIVTYPTNNPRYKNLYIWIIEDNNNALPSYRTKPKLSADSLENIIIASDIFKRNLDIKIEKNEFTSIKYKAYNTELSLRMNECIIQVLSDFYIDSKTVKAKTDLVQIGALRDSLKYTLEQLERASAGFEDATKYVAKVTTNLPKLKQDRLYGEVKEQYNAAASTYQNAHYKLMYESPIFQVLDKPIAPVEIVKESWINAFIIAFLLSFLFLTIISLRKLLFNMVVEEMNKNEE